jgi:hypothetical protein
MHADADTGLVWLVVPEFSSHVALVDGDAEIWSSSAKTECVLSV